MGAVSCDNESFQVKIPGARSLANPAAVTLLAPEFALSEGEVAAAILVGAQRLEKCFHCKANQRNRTRGQAPPWCSPSAKVGLNDIVYVKPDVHYD